MTWQPSEQILELALAHATAEMPREACGLVVGGVFQPVFNEAEQLHTFAMERDSYMQALKTGELQAIVHSHAYLPPIASQADLAMCEMTRVPWLIVSVPLNKWTVIEPSGYVAPLIGRQWGHGSLDCWGLVRDGFKAFTGIEMPDFDRRMEWWHRGDNTIMENVAAAGMTLLPGDTKLRHCDILILQVRAPVPNHLGLYIEPEGLILHHLANRTSVRETYGGYWASATVGVARHHDFLDYPPLPHDPADRRVWTGEIVGQEPS